MMKKWTAIFLMMVLISCGGGGGGGGDDDDNNVPQCSMVDLNLFVYEVMRDSYLWFDQVPETDYTRYASPVSLLEDLKNPMDEWSYIESKEVFDQYYEEGQYLGMGFALKFDASDNLRVAFVFDDSPAADTGFRRTDRILTINGRSVSLLNDMDEVWDEIYRYPSADIEWVDSDGVEYIESIAYDTVFVNTVLHDEIFDVAGLKVGYLAFESFIENSTAELTGVFSEFKAQNIDELILDLRYNGGGRMSVATHLAGLIGGAITNGQVFQEIQHNPNYTHLNESIYFSLPSDSLDLTRVYVLTTENTCSASESLINGLEPYVNVILIGDTTCGKPVGMYAMEYCEIVLLPIQFRNVNADGQTDYFDGIAPVQTVDDDLTHSFGDVDEDMLEIALYHIENHVFPVQISQARVLPRNQLRNKNKLNGFRKEIGAF